MDVSSQFAPTPVHGAAYRYILTRLDRKQLEPAACFNSERSRLALAEIDAVLAWAAGEAPHVRAAYQWAAQQVRPAILNTVLIHDNARAVSDAFTTLPKPPEEEGDANR